MVRLYFALHRDRVCAYDIDILTARVDLLLSRASSFTPVLILLFPKTGIKGRTLPGRTVLPSNGLNGIEVKKLGAILLTDLNYKLFTPYLAFPYLLVIFCRDDLTCHAV